jgi:hypothetical protein
MTKDLWYIVRIPTRTSNFKTMTNLFNLRFDRARANGNALCLQITIIDNPMFMLVYWTVRSSRGV